MNSSSKAQKPTSVIFLDIDGVLMGERGRPPLDALIHDKINELFIKKEGCHCGFTNLEWRIAASHFFYREAVANLESLIERVNQVARVVIVISSAWREDGTVEDIKQKMFATCSFSKYIIDKTPEEMHDSSVSEKKYGFDFVRRGRQIDFWLRENYKKLNIKSFVIFDDIDDEIKARYPDRFVHVQDLLSKSDIEKAYEIMTQFTLSSKSFPTQSQVAGIVEKENILKSEQCVIQ